MRVKVQKGFVLFDALFAVGLLSLALMLASYPLYKVKNAWQHAIISQYSLQLAANAIDRVRSNAGQATNNGLSYATASLWTGSFLSPCTTSCSANDLMRKDAYELSRQWLQHHPKAKIRINRCKSNALCVVLWWEENGANNNGCTTANCVEASFVP